MSGALKGKRVLVPRAGQWGARVSAHLEALDAIPVSAPVIRTADPRDTTDRTAAFDALADGGFDWVFFTSAAGVESLGSVLIPDSTRIAVVGAATEQALLRRGNAAAFLPREHSSAGTLAAEWVREHGATRARVLVVRSDLAAATLSDELQIRGHAVRVCVAYRTLGVDLPADVAQQLRSGGIDVVLLTSLSVARELRRQIGGLHPRVLVASIGEGTTADALSLGFSVHHTATQQSVIALLDELDEQRPQKDAS